MLRVVGNTLGITALLMAAVLSVAQDRGADRLQGGAEPLGGAEAPAESARGLAGEAEQAELAAKAGAEPVGEASAAPAGDVPASAPAGAAPATRPVAPSTSVVPPAPVPASPARELLTGWYGSWGGEARLLGPASDGRPFAMELHVQPISDRDAVTWTIVYGEGVGRQVRAYELVASPKQPGRFVMDEKNGILIDCQLIGDVLYSQFQVAETLLHSRFARVNGRIEVEIASFTPATPANPGELLPANVRSFALRSMQKGSLSPLPPATTQPTTTQPTRAGTAPGAEAASQPASSPAS